jgi:hypothetical protein
MRALRFAFLFVFCLAGCRAAGPGIGTEAVYLTWQRDPTTTMTIHWLSSGDALLGDLTWSPRGAEQWSSAAGEHHVLPGTDWLVHEVELTGLRPGGEYRFRLADQPEEYAFRTVPAEGPITFIDGGDVYRERLEVRIYEQAARFDPSFVVVGGDIVYDGGHSGNARRWYRWLRHWQEHMVGSDGCLIPMIVAIGNHEVAGGFGQVPEDAPHFYSLFAFPGPRGYGVLDIGGVMSLFVLDSGHTHPVEGEQAQWLAEAIAQRAAVPHLFATYHVPAFPSHRNFRGSESAVIRRHWVPIFERHGLDVAFEHHDHAYKRTHLIRKERVDPGGVLYLGDGAWGVAPRSVHDPARTWYLARAEPVNHFIVTTIRGEERIHLAVDAHGRVFDEVNVGSAIADAARSRAIATGFEGQVHARPQ